MLVFVWVVGDAVGVRVGGFRFAILLSCPAHRVYVRIDIEIIKVYISLTFKGLNYFS